MKDIISKYLNNDNNNIALPTDEKDQINLARTLLGYSIVKNLDYWLDIAQDYVENTNPKVPFIRDNDLRRKDNSFRETFVNLDKATKDKIVELINSTATGIVFSLLTNFDQFPFGDIILFLKPKSVDNTEIKISSNLDDLHDELSEWIYNFSKRSDELVEKEEDKYGISYRLK